MKYIVAILLMQPVPIFGAYSGVEIIRNHADYRLMSRRAVNALKDYRETNLFFRGLIPLMGFSSHIVYYKQNSRIARESKCPLRCMIAFAWEGITSLSVVPLRLLRLLEVVFPVAIHGDLCNGNSSIYESSYTRLGININVNLFSWRHSIA